MMDKESAETLLIIAGVLVFAIVGLLLI